MRHSIFAALSRMALRRPLTLDRTAPHLLRLLVLLAAVTIGAPAFAQEKVIMADCTDTGCRCTLTDTTYEEAEIAIGSAPPDGATTVVQMDGQVSWSTYSLSEVDLLAGGDGECPLELFEAMVPQDGHWVGTIVDQQITGCPAMLNSVVAGLTNSMVFPNDIRWGGSFHPDKLRLEGSAPAITWTRQSETYYTGAGPSAGSSMVEIRVDYTARLIHPRLIRVAVDLTVKADSVSPAVLAAAGLGNCDVHIGVDVRRTGA